MRSLGTRLAMTGKNVAQVETIMMMKRAEILAPSWPSYSFFEAARAQNTSRGSAVARLTLEVLKLALPKSLEDIFIDGWETFTFLVLEYGSCG